MMGCNVRDERLYIFQDYATVGRSGLLRQLLKSFLYVLKQNCVPVLILGFRTFVIILNQECRLLLFSRHQPT